ncbi:OsmC family protein [Kaistella sp.]|uniref:OsmC family protein n=1 Tax=Kaistella sp. TaxID=2782235 RepID=UPI003C4F3073
MVVTVKASLGQKKYYTEVIAGENKLITDEPVSSGGENKGFNPFEIMATSLASCTAATLRTFIARKNWEVEFINVEVHLENFPQTKTAVFERNISYEGANLDAEQLAQLHNIAELCPIHKLLHGTIEINTKFKE